MFTIAALVLMLFSQMAIESSLFEDALAGSCTIIVEEPRLASTRADPDGNLTITNKFIISTAITNNNCSDQDIKPFVLILEVRNSVGVTEQLSWQDGVIQSPAGIDDISLQWMPAHAGKYEIRTFAINDFETPQVLSPLVKKLIDVDLTANSWTYSEPSEPFTIVLIPDTQNYWDSGNQEIAYNQSKWIVKNKDKLNIQLVIHLGDIVDAWNSNSQWTKADHMMRILDDNDVSYIALPGNHDFGNPYSYALSRNYSNFERYFPESRVITDQNLEVKKITPNAANLYTLLSIGDNDFLVVSMEYCPTLDVIKQVSDTIKQHSDIPVILATHAFLRSNGSWASVSGGGVCTAVPGTEDFTTEPIWDLVVYPNPNVFLVVSGHSGGENKRIDQNEAGKPVQQVVIDYQYLKNGGDGMLKIIRFEPEKDQIHFQTYSPWLDTYSAERRNDFTFDYDME
ncbi:MAG: hypothetical protein HMLIMOIP_001981 [Candidatus Nitrosomirales archaeon]|jgi:hypothetical protein